MNPLQESPAGINRAIFPQIHSFFHHHQDCRCTHTIIQFSLLCRLCDPCDRTPGFPVYQNSQSLLQLTSIESVMLPSI